MHLVNNSNQFKEQVLSPYIVSEVPKEEWDDVFLQAEKWHQQAKERGADPKRNGKFLDDHIDRMNASNKDQLMSSDDIRTDHTKFKNIYWNTLLVCRDSDEKIQAIACYHSIYKSIESLTSNPDNHNDSSMEEAEVQIIMHLAKKKDSRLYVYEVPECSKLFWKRLHFVEAASSSMILTSDTIRDLKSNHIFPSD